MDDKVNPAVVGGFVLVLGALLVAGVLWLAAGLGRQQSVDPYQAVIQESVAGLSVDAPVKYLGVDVGKVDRIEIDPSDSKQVRLHFLLARGTPVKHDSVAVLKTQGLTGIAYVELSGGSVGSPPLRPTRPGEVPMIPFKPSLSARLENVLTSVLNNIDRVSNNLNAVFDADNRAALKSTLTDMAALAHGLAGQQATIHAGLADAARTTALTARAAEQFGPTLQSVTRSAASVAQMADVARAASARAGDAADAATRSVQQIGTDTLPEIARLMAELGEFAASLRQLSEQTAGSPNSLLMGKPPLPLGPGESAP
jgi:phospholipid/cholesterol/gamma-HCH transport system substrate-binding protein